MSLLRSHALQAAKRMTGVRRSGRSRSRWQRVRIRRCLVLALCLLFGARALAAANRPPGRRPENARHWRIVRGNWRFEPGRVRQKDPSGLTCAILDTPVLRDPTVSVEIRIAPRGTGVRAAALCFGAAGTMSYYWLHLDSRNDNVILVRSTRDNPWGEIRRRHCRLDTGRWFPVSVRCRGRRATVEVRGRPVLKAVLPKPATGRIGLGTSQGQVEFKDLEIKGIPVQHPKPLAQEAPMYKIISRGPAAGVYQAFPDACRLAGGDILVVFYAGYAHVSLPNRKYPKGGRICMVRSRDEGRTWSQPQVLYDDAMDNRDPHVAQLSDGTVVCTFFSLSADPARPGRWRAHSARMVRSLDQGKTWETQARPLCSDDWLCSAPVRELPDGVCLLGVYSNRHHYGGVLRSLDHGKTWSSPIPIGKGSGVFLDAETDVIRLRDGTIYAALRSSRVNMHYALSHDEGRTWTAVRDIGFKAHAPHLYRLSTGPIVLTHRIPGTAMHVSRDEGRTWQGPYRIDTVSGAYPSTVELNDGSLLVVYYEEGAGSAIRAKRFRLTPGGLKELGWN